VIVGSQPTLEIEYWPLDKLVPFEKNARIHSPEQIAQIAASIREFGFNTPILVDRHDGIIAGHGRLLAARQVGLAEVSVIILDHLTGNQKRAYILADNKLAEGAGWDDAVLSGELATLRDADFDLEMLGFDDDELRLLLAQAEPDTLESGESQNESIPETPVEPVTRAGDLWRVGEHRLICGDCRDSDTLARLFDGVKANLVITSPPYATQREYDPSSGFQPVRPEEYVAWFRDVAKNIAAVLAPDGSYFLNIKEHCAEGERSLYVMDLVIAHKRQWAWRYLDQFCWRKTDNGVPGYWPNRFKNAWEPVFHFCRQSEIKFRPKAAGHASEDCFDYSPRNPKSTSGSGLLGTGPRGDAAGKPAAEEDTGRFTGIARPSNVIEVKTETGQGLHSAPFPRALVEFFVKSFSDPGDIVCDMFVGSGTVIAAAQVLNRAGYGVEISPGYCDVALRRIAHLTGEEPVLAETGATMCQVAAGRGVPYQQAQDAGLPRSTVPNTGGRQ
jgi:DNA modification methylase